MKLFRTIAAGLAAALMASSAMAAPIAYNNAPLDTIQGAINTLTQSINNTFPSTSPTVFCTGTTTATCQGIRIAVSYTGLTTAAGVTATAQTVTDASVVAASQILCQVNGYAGTGNPVALNVIPGAGSFTYQLENTHASAALNATVVTVCFVYN